MENKSKEIEWATLDVPSVENSIPELLGVTMQSVVATGDEMIFCTLDGTKFHFWHSQDCCESVCIEDIIGDLADLVGAPLVIAEEISSADQERPADEESYTWTFYRFATVKGTVTVRWIGTSNGYYSESVDFSRMEY